MAHEAPRGKAILLSALIALILAPYAAASVITGFNQLRYSGDLSVNSTTLSLMTANATRVYITQSGLIGIGTALPSDALHVIGTTRLAVNDTNNISTSTVLTLDHFINNPLNSTGGIGIGLLFRAMDNGSNVDDVALINATLTSAINGSEDSSLGFYTRNGGGALAPRLFINGSKVGINMTSPAQTLHVIGTLNATPAAYSGTAVLINATGSLVYQGNEVCTAANGICNAASGGWTDDGTVVRLTAAGDFVGIGTTTPSEKLYVSGNGTYTGDLVLGGDLLFTGGQGSGASSLGWVDDGTKVRLATASDSVGIGTASPNENLVVIGNVNVSGTLNVSGRVSFPNVASCTEALETDSNGVIVCGTDAGGASDIRNSTAWNRTSTNVVLANIGDNVGIGTASPTDRLDVNGNTTIRGNFTVGSNVFFVNNNSSGNVGIGTGSPGTKLDVAGGATIRGTANDAEVLHLGVNGLINAIVNSGDTMVINIDSNSDSTGNFFSVGHDGTTYGTAELFRVQENGNAGIGTTAPLSLLHVNDSSVGGAFRVTNVSGTTIFFVNGSSGSVGIGTTSPTSKLQIDAKTGITDVANVLTLQNTGDTAALGTGVNLSFSVGATNEMMARIGMVNDVTDSASLRFFTRNAGTLGERVRIDNAGNVGIGTTTPGERLHINGALAAIMLNDTDDGNAWRISASRGNIPAGAFGIESYNGTSAARFAIDVSGNVGIGTTAPLGRLAVVGAGYNEVGTIYTVAHSVQDQTTYRGIGLGYDSSSQTGVITGTSAGAASNIAFWAYNSGYGEKMRITGTGNVGIGTTTPSEKLSVSGNLSATTITGSSYIKSTIGMFSGSGTTSAENGVATTIFTISGNPVARYMVVATLASAVANYGSSADIVTDAASAGHIYANNASGLTITVSGSNVQVTQTSGVTANVLWRYLLIADGS